LRISLEVGGTCGTHRRGEKSVNVLVKKPEGKRKLGRPRCRWEDGIRMGLREIGWWGCRVDFVCAGFGAVTLSCEYCNEPSGSGELVK
jgi:hypothetical protein